MNEHPDAQDRLHVRGLLAETGIDESPELLAGLLALRAEARGSAPEPTGTLAALLDGTPVPLKSKRRRGIILSTALVGAMAAGATGVAANPDFLVRADPAPAVSFMPEEAPTLERGTAEPAAPEETAAPAVQVPDVAAAPAVPEVPAAAVPVPQDPAPAPAVPAPAAPAPLPAPEEHPGQGLTHPGGRGAVQPPVIPVPEPNHRADGAHRYLMGPGNGAALFGGRDWGWGQGYGQGQGYGYGYGGYPQGGWSGWGR